MNITNIYVFGFQPALHAMRNPLESWDKGDSKFYEDSPHSLAYRLADNTFRYIPWDANFRVPECPLIGPEDLKLALKLIKAGPAHRKFMRQIIVWWDITIPRAIWQELDTYKVATVRNSCSTMHKLGSRDLDESDFEGGEVMDLQLAVINELGAEYRADKTPERLHKLKMHLTEGFLQMATYTFSYETALNMYADRVKHRMPEWSGEHGICAVLRSLPYMSDFIEAAAGQRG